MAAENSAGRDRPPPHGLFRIQSHPWSLYLTDDELDDAVEDFLLIGDVFVDRHRLDAEFGPQATHRQSTEPVSIGHVNGSSKDPLSGEGRAG